MNKVYIISIIVVIAFYSCKLKEDKQADQQKVPDNTSALNNKASNDAGGWEKINSTSATGTGTTTGTMGKQIEAMTSTDQQKRYSADSLERAMASAKLRKEDSLRKIRVRDSLAFASRNTSLNGNRSVTARSNSGGSASAGRPKPSKSVVSSPATNAVPLKQPSVPESTGGEGVDDFNTVTFKKKTHQASGIDAGETSTPAPGGYTGKERFDEIDVSIPAVVYERTSVSNGGSISVRTTKAQYIGQGITLPAGTTVTGFADLTDDRLNVNIRSVNYNGRILRLTWKVYDVDGAEGIAVNNATLKRNASSGTNQTLSAAGQLLTGNGTTGQLTGGLVRSVLSGSGRVSISIEGGKKLIIKSAN